EDRPGEDLLLRLGQRADDAQLVVGDIDGAAQDMREEREYGEQQERSAQGRAADRAGSRKLSLAAAQFAAALKGPGQLPRCLVAPLRVRVQARADDPVEGLRNVGVQLP